MKLPQHVEYGLNQITKQKSNYSHSFVSWIEMTSESKQALKTAVFFNVKQLKNVNKFYQLIKPALYIAILILLFAEPIRAQQNLIYNGDFEDSSSCPVGYSNPLQNPKEIEKCIGWKAPTYGTSDYYNVCAIGTNVAIPLNPMGEQSPFSGSGYLGGFFTNYTGGNGDDGYAGSMWWEYVQGQLVTSLESGKVYRFSMEISLAEYSDLMITEIGAYFSETSISSPNTASLTHTPQCVFSDSDYFSDTVNWIHLETLYQATGNEKFLTLGNFRNNLTTDTLRRYTRTPFVANPFFSYYYIDNVQLVETNLEKPAANIFSPNGDGINDVWTFPYSDQKNPKRIQIINRWGNIITEGDLNGFKWDGTVDMKECDDGVYFFKISNTNIAGFIQLVR